MLAICRTRPLRRRGQQPSLWGRSSACGSMGRWPGEHGAIQSSRKVCVAAIASSSVLTELALAGCSVRKSAKSLRKKISESARRIAPGDLSCRAALHGWAGCYSFQTSITTGNIRTRVHRGSCPSAFSKRPIGIVQVQNRLLLRRWRPRSIPRGVPTPPGARQFRRMRRGVHHTKWREKSTDVRGGPYRQEAVRSPSRLRSNFSMSSATSDGWKQAGDPRGRG